MKIKRQSPTFRNYLRKVGWRQKLRILRYNLSHSEIHSLYPLGAKIEINGACNLNCVMCYRTSLENRDRIMTLEEFKTILDHLPSLVEWSPHGYNEPMLHPRFWAFLNEGKRRGLLLTLVTNATLLTPKRADQLIKYHTPNRIIVSIDGVGETYEKIRRGASYAKVKENLLHLAAHSQVTGVDVSLAATIWDENIDQIPGLIALAEELECPISIGDITWSYQYLKSTEEHSIRENWAEHEIEDEIEPFLGHPLANIHLGKPKKRRCTLPWSHVYVDVVGDVYPCTDNLDYLIGNVYQKPISELFNNGQYKAFRAMSLHGIRNNCKNCGDWAPYGGRE